MNLDPESPTTAMGRKLIWTLFARNSVGVGDELLGFGTRVVKVTFAKFCDSIVPARFIGKRLVNKSMLSEFVPQSSVDMRLRGSINAVSRAQFKNNSFRRNRRDFRVVKHLKNETINSRHPRNQRRRH